MNKSRRSKIRAPLTDGSYIVSPIDNLDSIVENNTAYFVANEANAIINLTREEFESRRSEAREQLLSAAKTYVAGYTSKQPKKSEETSTHFNGPLILSGHQPEFFHPGVWFKNFFIDKLARSSNGTSINLIIDNDVYSSRSITVPTGTLENPQRTIIAYDGTGDLSGNDNKKHSSARPSEPSVVPIETATWRDPSATNRFPEEFRNAIQSLLPQKTILDLVWTELVSIQKECPYVGESIARSRHLLEIEKGIGNLEVPLSNVCKQTSFCRFLADILLNAGQFHSLYNNALDEFRRENKVRSQSHPVPSLVNVDEHIELPFWIWSKDSPWRGPLYVKVESGRLVLTDKDTIFCHVTCGDRMIQDLSELSRTGIAIRPRALMTTMFARVFLSDVFVHGIGGAKYDELTDQLIRGFYGLRPPTFLTASSTHLLPLGASPIGPLAMSSQKQRLRSLKFHPELQVAGESTQLPEHQWIRKKKSLLEKIPPRGQKKSWHAEMEEANNALQKLIQPQLNECEEDLAELQRQRRKTEILASREYSILLHPTSLIQVLDQISTEAANKFI